MKKTKSKAIAFVAAMALLMSFSGMGLISCSDSDSGGNDNAQETPKPEPEPEPSNPPKTAEPTVPVFSPVGGFYKTKQNVAISCEGASEIFYTVLTAALDSNGNWNETAWKNSVAKSKPTEESTKYNGAFEVGEQCIVRAMAKFPDGTKRYAMTSFDFDLDRSTDFDGSWTPVNPESDNWQDQTIYFILTDRFFNGDTTNDHVEGLTDPNGNPYNERDVLEGQPASGYNGGDIEGIRQKLSYIKDLGFTAIWMTPPVKCQIAESNYHGYHGYWASDFTKVDSHMGTLAQYQRFVKEAHDLGLYVIQDIVVNHLGDYQQIKKDVTAEKWNVTEEKWDIPSSEFYFEPKSIPFSHPEQLPWALNDVRDITLDEWQNNSFYHFNTEISDYTNQYNMYTHSSSNLDDMVTENEVVRNLLRGYFRYWIDKCGIDGYRIDTALYVEPDFFEGFINDTDANNMGVREYGLSKGKKDFINFGEAFSQDEKIVGSYTKSSSGTARMDGMIYFPLRYALADTISSGGKTNAIGTVLNNRYTKGYYANPDRLVTFIDNHDIDRWGQTMKGNTELMKAAYNIIYTIPGIPQVYYGSEQGFDGQCREGMFEGSFYTPGTTKTSDSFDTNGDWYKYFQNLNKMRKENRVFRYNTLKVLQETADSAGIFAYIVRERDPADAEKYLADIGNKAIFVMNTASTDKILDASYANIAVGDKFTLVPYEGISVCPADGTQIEESFVASADGKKGNVKLIVPANSCAVYILTEKGLDAGASGCEITVDEIPTDKVTGSSITVKGKTTVSGDVKIVLNGDYTLAQTVNATANVQFSKDIDVKAYSNGKITVQMIQTVDGVICYSEQKSFTIERPFTLIKRVDDPKDDDNGVGVAKGILQRPTDAPFKGALDIQGVEVYRSGNDVLLGVKMGAVSHGWNPTSNQFDHVVPYIFISNGNDSDGCEYHPKSNYKLPDSFGKWDYMFQCNGWGQSYYSSSGADSSTFGKAVTPAPANTPTVAWEQLEDADGKTLEQYQDLDSEGAVIEKYAKLDWSGYAPEIGSVWADKPGMIWIKISAAAMGYPSDITGYKFYINTWDFDMGSPRGLKAGDSDRYKFGSGTLSVDDVPLVCDETNNVIVIE
ncbi:alpha-amylase family glycosyl hydrolase [uncultured Treponema sp.]|uniref:alpha-amylase family glycosyl hydrolase n=1 Tax=uncultured Treponema sp. TaxID=162155 RepID=UPI0025EA201F|nr:alpha-amylase family glycosyl hydrolase [uncultured Treponema sp.]